MHTRNPHAGSILGLPAARHPQLAGLAQRLAGKADLTVDEAAEILQAACADAGITALDVDMIQPGASVAVPFAATTRGDAASEYQEGVSSMVRARLAGMTR